MHFFKLRKTRIQLLQPKSFELLTIICKHFLKPEFLKDLTINFDFLKIEHQKSLNEVYLGTECESYLEKLITEGHADVVANIRQNSLQFYITAAQEICKRLPISDPFLSKLKVIEVDTALHDSNRQTSERISERIFSLLPDLKTKKRNKLSSVTVNASCVLKSALKARRENAPDIKITDKHLTLMSTDKLCSTCPKKAKSHLTLYAADSDDNDEINHSSTSHDSNNNV